MENDIEIRRLELDEKKLEQESEFRMKELELKREELRRSRWSSPLVLGIIAATIAAAGNGYVSWLSAENQLTVERTRYSSQKEIERSKAEADRILEATKASNPKDAAARIKFLTEVGLISDPNRQAALDTYLRTEDPGTPTPSTNPIIVPYESGWLGGGNNQADQCAIGRAVVAQNHTGKTILLKSSSEDSKKDFFGRVEYKYFCLFEVS